MAKKPKSAPVTASIEPETAPQTALAGAKVKVKFLRSHPEYGYFPPAEAEISREAFDRIQKSGPFFEEI